MSDTAALCLLSFLAGFACATTLCAILAARTLRRVRAVMDLALALNQQHRTEHP